MDERTTKASVISRCTSCGWRIQKPADGATCEVCAGVLCTSCMTEHDLLARHFERDAEHYLARAQVAFWMDEEPRYARMVREGRMQVREMIERLIDTRLRRAMELKDPKRSARRFLALARALGHETFATHLDRIFAARILAMDARGDLPSQAPSVPMMCDVDGLIVQFTPAADLPDTLPPLLRRRLLRPPVEEETFDDDRDHDNDNDGSRACCDE